MLLEESNDKIKFRNFLIIEYEVGFSQVLLSLLRQINESK